MDKSSFKRLFDEHYQPLCNYAFRIIHDLDEAEDIVQEVFVKLWHQRTAIEIKKNPTSYIYTMVRNQAFEVIRRSTTGLRVKEDLRYIQENAVLQNVDDVEIEKYLLIDQIYTSIRQLPPKCGEIFTMSKINGLTYTQIAETLDISVKTVESQMGKALRLLRTMLADKMSFFCFFIMCFN